jgi:16S rRNA processing protein RimM
VTVTAPDRLVVGRVLRPHGIKGELSVEVLSDAAERFTPGAELGVGDPDGPEPLGTAVVTAARRHQGRLLLSFEGVEDRAAADR